MTTQRDLMTTCRRDELRLVRESQGLAVIPFARLITIGACDRTTRRSSLRSRNGPFMLSQALCAGGGMMAFSVT
jgi:hypothetical protein